MARAIISSRTPRQVRPFASGLHVFEASPCQREGRRKNLQPEIGSTSCEGAASVRRTPHHFLLFIGDRLTGSRLRFTAAATVVVSCLLLALSFATTRDNRTA